MRAQNVLMFRRATCAAKVAEWLYRAYTGDDTARLSDLPAEKQMRFHSEAEAAISRLIVADRRVS